MIAAPVVVLPGGPIASDPAGGTLQRRAAGAFYEQPPIPLSAGSSRSHISRSRGGSAAAMPQLTTQVSSNESGTDPAGQPMHMSDPCWSQAAVFIVL